MTDYQEKNNIPKLDYLKDFDLNNHHDIERIIEILCDHFEYGYFLRWEAVECLEKGLTLTEKQEEVLSELVCFNDDEMEIFYIDEIPRPNEPWHVIVNKIAENLLVSEFKTYEIHCETTTEGWPRLAEIVENYGYDLMLPDGVSKPIEIVPPVIRHKLWLQSCFMILEGLGQEQDLTLEDKEQFRRVEEFIEKLTVHKNSIEYLQLNLEKLFNVLILPTKDKNIFVDSIMQKLNLHSTDELIANSL